MDKIIKDSFCIKIDYEKDSPNPSRVFKTMTDLIDSFQQIDKDLIKCIDNKIEPSLILEDIEIGSLKTYISNILKAVDDDAIKNLDWKPAVGKYLLKAKYIIVDLLDGKTSITDKKQIEGTRRKILELAESTGIKKFPDYTPIETKSLINGIDKINKSLSHLDKRDKAQYITSENTANFNLDLNFAPSQIEDLMTKETIESKSIMILKVKKPDYLGDSKWDFKYDNHSIQVKILDYGWIKSFQKRQIDIRPGDSIRAEIVTEVKYGFDNDVVSANYNLIKVQEVIPMLDNNQHEINYD